MYDRGEILTEEERLQILDWVCKNYFEFVDHRENFREAPLYEDDPKLPPIIWEIRNRIIKREGIEAYAESYNENFFLKFHASLKGVTRDKLFVLSAADDGNGELAVHRDMNQGCGFHTRANVFLSVPKGDSKTYYAGHEVETKERGYVICRSGIDWHWAEPIKHTEKPRIAISFGFMLPKHVIDRIYKVPSPGWGLRTIFYRAYDYIENALGFSVEPFFTRLKCETGVLPSKAIPKESPLYKRRPRGIPPFRTMTKGGIW